MWSVSNFVMVRLYMIPPKSFGRGGWACLREVPISETLQIYYYNKKVLFLYLSPLLVIIGWWWSWCPEAGAQSVSWVFVALCGVYVIGLFHTAAAQCYHWSIWRCPSLLVSTSLSFLLFELSKYCSIVGAVKAITI